MNQSNTYTLESNCPAILYGIESLSSFDSRDQVQMKALILFSGKERICIPIPNVKMEETDVKIIKDIMNWDKGTVKEKLSVVYSFLRYLKRKQAK